MKLCIWIFSTLIILLNISLQAQNITNTLGANGQFIVKDGVNNFLSLDQSTGNAIFYRNLELGGTTNSTPTVGVITKNGSRFIHNYSAIGSFLTNTFIGLYSGNFTLSSSSYHNTAVGYSTLNQLTDGRQNCAFGFLSMNKNTSGNFNSAYGVSSLESNTIGNSNSAFGNFVMRLNTEGSNNSAFGAASLSNNQTGSSNSAFGVNSLLSNTIGNSNSAFGDQALYQNSSGNSNSSFGFFGLRLNTTGSNNSAFGAYALNNNTTGFYNAAFGTRSLYNNISGNHNTAVGHKSLYSNVSGFQNTAVGDSALYYNTGNYNTAIGYNAGSNVTTGANLTLIGIDANPSTGTAIDEITLGNQFVKTLRCAAPGITSLSDERDKKNIKDLSLGLEFIAKLKPRQFNWDRRDWYKNQISDGSKMQETPTAGFIAQELDSAQMNENAEWLNLVLKDNPDKWEATYGNLLPVMVKAIQELKIENDNLKSEIEDLKSLKEQLAEIQYLKSELVEQVRILKSERTSTETKFTSVGN